MQPTALGKNLTGAAMFPSGVKAMNEAAATLSPAMEIDTSEIDVCAAEYIAESDAVGSVPPPISSPGSGKQAEKAAAKAAAGSAILVDKIGERLAFERTGTRLYDALIRKAEAALALDPQALPPAMPQGGEKEGAESPLETLLRIRTDELDHFQLLCESMTLMGGDPTAQTPCADVSAVASSGIMQVLTDPRTTLAQCLSAILTAELTDNAGWELLIGLAESQGRAELVGPFLAALGQEQEHLETIKTWLTALVSAQPASTAV